MEARKLGWVFPQPLGPERPSQWWLESPSPSSPFPDASPAPHRASGMEAQPTRAGLHVRPTAFHLDGRLLDLQKERKPQCDTFPFSVLKHTTMLAYVFPTSQGKMQSKGENIHPGKHLARVVQASLAWPMGCEGGAGSVCYRVGRRGCHPVWPHEQIIATDFYMFRVNVFKEIRTET